MYAYKNWPSGHESWGASPVPTLALESRHHLDNTVELALAAKSMDEPVWRV